MRFVLMIIGNDPVDLLARYKAFDGLNNDVRYVQEIDMTSDVLGSISKGHTLEEALREFGINNIAPDKSKLELDGRYTFRYAIVKNGTLIKAVDRINPNARFDECGLGCSRPGFFLLKPHRQGTLGEDSIIELEKTGEHQMDRMADSAYKKDIDFEETRNRAGEEAKNTYERIEALFGGSIPQLQYLWDDPIYNDMSEEDKIKHYHNQEARRIVDRVIDSRPDIFPFPDVERIQGSKENFIRNAKKSAFTICAILTENNWYEVENIVTTSVTVERRIIDHWDKVCNDLIDSASDDTLLTICTCHV